MARLPNCDEGELEGYLPLECETIESFTGGTLMLRACLDLIFRFRSTSPYALLALMVVAPVGAARTGESTVRYLPEARLWVLETEQTSYVLGVNERNELQSVYRGKKLTHDQDLVSAHSRAEYPFDSADTMTNGKYPCWGGRQ